MYDVGWNLIWFTDDSSGNFNMINFKRWDSTAKEYSTGQTDYSGQNHAIIGGSTNGSNFNDNSFQGIIHSVFVNTNTGLTSVQIYSSLGIPRDSNTVLCDYFIASFPNLNVKESDNSFKNIMFGLEGSTATFSDSNSITPDPTLGIPFSSGQTQTISSFSPGNNKAIGFQMWVQGSYTGNNDIVTIYSGGNIKIINLKRSSNDIIVETDYSGATISFSSAISTLSSSTWTFWGISIGWISRSNNYMMCAYISQSSTKFENWVSGISISDGALNSGSSLSVKIGGVSAYVREAYITDYLEHYHVFDLFKNTFGTERYIWKQNYLQAEPNYLSSGCGNGYIYSNEHSEQCDDGNNNNGDGCSSTCQEEALYDCTQFYNYLTSNWDYVCRNNVYEPEHQEQCDDGNNSTLDGWDDKCEIENGWDWSTSVAGSPSVCNGICGDSYRVSDEAWDDGNNADSQGWLSNWSGAINGYTCIGGNENTTDTWAETCGEGYITHSEQCDDGNTDDYDGWSATWQMETGWNCTNIVNGTGHDVTTCTPICGDGLKVNTEPWDDGNISDSQGCLSNWTGEMNGWYCNGGNRTTADIWIEQCNDGFITISEQWEDQNSISGDGCDTWVIETGWLCTNNTQLTFSTCEPIWGDGLVVGNETWDDGDDTDGEGCNEECNGEYRGWYCSPSSSPAYVWNTQLMDGIHIASTENWDDGNSIDTGDGCTNSGIVEDKWDCEDDILLKSVWVPRCSNGKRNDDEEWDDTNIIDSDGWSFYCIIEDGWQWFGGSLTTRDYWYEQPVASIVDISKINEVKISFTEEMHQFSSDTNYTDYFNITVTGPGEPYIFTILYGFSNSTIFYINFTVESITYGNKQDKFYIDFDQQLFISQNNTTLYNSRLEDSLYKVPIMPDVVKIIGTTADTAISSTLTVIIVSNIITGQSSELMWSFFKHNTDFILLPSFRHIFSRSFISIFYVFLIFKSSNKIWSCWKSWI